VEIQRGMAQREPEVPEEQRIRFRIGINLGDVIVEEHDISRRGECGGAAGGLAEPGGVFCFQHCFMSTSATGCSFASRMFLAFAGQARRRNEDHALALEATPRTDGNPQPDAQSRWQHRHQPSGRNLGPEHSSDSLASGRGLRPDNPLAQAPYLTAPFSLSTPSGMAALNAEVMRQAAMVAAYIDDFKLIILIALASIPLLLLLREARRLRQPPATATAAVSTSAADD